MKKIKMLDLFAGVGVALGAEWANVEDLGVENDPNTLKTRTLNKFTTIYEDVWDIQKSMRGEQFEGIWASPPCQTFSVALSEKSGVKAAPIRELENAIHEGVWKNIDTLKSKENEFGDPRSSLVLTPLTYTYIHNPKFLILEQVPGVLPLWEAYKPHLEELGYGVWTGILNSEDFGVPQTRRRAYLIAYKGRKVSPHNPKLRPRTMQEALGWGLTERPAPTITSKVGVTNSATGTQKVYERAIEAGEFIFRPGGSDKPSTVATTGIAARYAPGRINTKVDDNKVLQSFPREMVFHGSTAKQQLQIGNAVPPLVAKYLLKGLTSEIEKDKLKI